MVAPAQWFPATLVPYVGIELGSVAGSCPETQVSRKQEMARRKTFRMSRILIFSTLIFKLI